MVSAVIVGKTRLFREALARDLNDSTAVAVVSTAGSTEEVLASAADVKPDLLLLEAGTGDAPMTVRLILDSMPRVKVIVVGLPEAEPDVIAYAEAGISGYVPAEGKLSDLEAVIRSVEQGEVLCSPRIVGSLFRHIAELAADRPEGTVSGVPLTSRQMEVVS